MSHYETCSLVLGAATLIAGLAVAIIYFFQLQAMRHTAQVQVYMSLVQILQSPDVRIARKVVLEDLKSRTFEEWNSDEKLAASTVCSTFTTAGVFLKEKMVNLNLVRGWGPSARACLEICRPLIQERRQRYGDRYWHPFEDFCSATDK